MNALHITDITVPIIMDTVASTEEPLARPGASDAASNVTIPMEETPGRPVSNQNRENASETLFIAPRSVEDTARSLNADEWMVILYDDLRGLAHARMARQRPNHTLQATALVHEAYARMKQRNIKWESRAHFFWYAARAMRDLLVEHARRRLSARRGGDLARVTFTLSMGDDNETMSAEELLRLHDALELMSTRRPDLAQLIILRFFGGLTYRELVACTGTPLRTIQRNMRASVAWLKEQMNSESHRQP